MAPSESEYSVCAVVKKSGSLNFLEPSGPVFYGIALPFTTITDNYFIVVFFRVLLKMGVYLKKPSVSMFSRAKVIFIVEISLVINI